MKTKIHAFRLQHKDSKLGIFIHDKSTFPKNSNDSKYIWDFEFSDTRVMQIVSNFRKIPAIFEDLPAHFDNEEISTYGFTAYKCAFNSVEDLFSILPIHLIEFILTFDFQVVEVTGVGVKSPHQTFFKEDEVKIKPVKLNKLLNKLAKKEAKKHIGKSLNNKNYIIDGFWDF